MAIDPSISLQIAPVPQIDLTRIQQLRNLMGQEQLMGQQFLQAQLQQQLTQAEIPIRQAQLPLIQAQARAAAATASQLERDVEFNRVQQEIADKFINPVTQKMNVDAYTTELQRRGFMDKATPLLQSAAAAEATQLANLRTDQDRAVAASNWFETQASRLGLMLHGLSPELRADAFNKEATILDQIGPRGLNTAQQLRSLFFTQKPDGTVEFNNDKVNALYRARIDALQQENLKIEQISKFLTDDGKRPDSPISKELKKFLKDTYGIGGLEAFSAAQIATNPRLGQLVDRLVDSSVVSSQARTQADALVKDINVDIGNIDSLLTTVNRIKSENAAQLPTVMGTRLADLISRNIIQDKTRAELVAAANEYNRKNPDNKIDITSMTMDQMESFFNERKRNLNNTRIELEKRAARATLTQQQPEGAGQPAQPAAPGKMTEAQARANAAEFAATTPGAAEAQRRTTAAKKDSVEILNKEFDKAIEQNDYASAKQLFEEIKFKYRVDMKPYEIKLFNLEKTRKSEAKAKPREFTKAAVAAEAKRLGIPEERLRQQIESSGGVIK